MIVDELISVRHGVVAGGDRGHVCVPGSVTRSIAGPWECSVLLGGSRAAALGW